MGKEMQYEKEGIILKFESHKQQKTKKKTKEKARQIYFVLRS
jgi:hypothetical protein